MTIEAVDLTAGTRPRERLLAEVPETRMGLGVGLVALLTAVLHAAGAGPTAGLVMLGLVVAAAAAVLPLPLAALVAVGAWAFLTGFLANTLGVLTFGYADLARAAILLAVAAVGTVVRSSAGQRPS